MKYQKYTGLGIAATLLAVVAFSIHAFVEERIEQAEEIREQGRVAGRYDQEFIMTRDLATNTIPRDRLVTAYKIANQKRALMANQEDALPVYWQERGPNNVGGRTRSILYDANDATGNAVWAASVSGGLWRTNNITAPVPTWNLVNDFFPNLAITCIVQDPANPQTMYFGTGEEGNGNADAVRGLGVWRSLDGGANWTRLTATFNAINRMAVANDGTVYAATSTGLFRSTNNGQLFTNIRANGQNVQDVEIAANGDVFIAINGSGIDRLRAGTWTSLSGTALPSTGFRRIELACAPGNANVVYAMYATPISMSQSTCLGIFSSANGGDNWTARAVPSLGTFCWYALTLAVDPNDAARVWAGNQNLFVSGDNGDNWTGIGAIHADHHVVIYRPGSSTEVLFGNDGGIYRSTNGNAATPTVTERNNSYNVTQYYANAIHPTSGSNYILGGTQDNGTQRLNSAGLAAADQPTGADGAFCFIDQDNANVQITGSQVRQFFISTNAGASFGNLLAPTTYSLFITPAGYDNANNVFYYSDNTGNYGRITDVGGANTNSTLAATGLSGRASAFCVSPNNNKRLFIGSENGSIIRVDNADAAATFTTISVPSMVGSYVSCITSEANNDSHLLVVFSNYGDNSVWESTNGGTTWTSIEGDLPDMPVRWAMFHPFNSDQVLLATELGVWSTDDLSGNATQWWPTNNYGLANVRIDMLQYRASDHLVAAATHGRGMYTTDYFTLLDNCPLNVFVGGAISPGIYMAEEVVTSDGIVSPGKKVILHAGGSVLMQPGFHAQNGSDVWALILPCGTGVPKPGKANESDLAYDRRSSPPSIGELAALHCAPNPSAYSMNITCDLPEEGMIQLYIRSIQGELVQTICTRTQQAAGMHQFQLDATQMVPGLYLLILQTDKGAVTEKFVVAR